MGSLAAPQGSGSDNHTGVGHHSASVHFWLEFPRGVVLGFMLCGIARIVEVDLMSVFDRRPYLTGIKRLVIKIGTGVLTDRAQLDRRVIGRLADEMSLLKESGLEVVLISSGSVATGAASLGLARRPLTIPGIQAASAAGQAKLMQEYETCFDRYNVKVAQVLLTLDDLVHRRRYLNARNCLAQLSDWNVLPIINENDTVSVDELKFGDNDNLSAMIATMVEADLYINLTKEDGFYTANPARDPEATLIQVVDELRPELEDGATQEGGAWGLGGMLSKVRAAYKVALAGIPAVIGPGKRENVLREVLAGEPVGTFFQPHKRVSGRKHWIAFTLKSKGRVVIDKGAARAVCRGGKSLLPSGVVQVEGPFDAGDQVRVMDQTGHPLAVGLTNYSSTDLDLIKGLKSGQIKAALGHKRYDEVIHRDNMFVPDEEDESLCQLL